MSIFSLLSEFIRDIRQQKLRTFLTIFGIMWGTATIIVLLAFGMGFRDQMEYNMRGIGDQVVIMFPGRTSKAHEGYGIGRQIIFRESDAWLLQRQISDIKDICPEYTRWGTQVRYGDRANTPNVTGIYPIYGDMRNIFAQPGGRFINNIDIQERRRVVFLGDKLKDLLFEGQDAIGEMINLGGIPFMVIGVMESKNQNSSYNARDQDRAFIPASTFSAIFGTDRINNIIYTPSDPTKFTEVHNQIYQVLSSRHRFAPDDKDAVLIWDTNEFWKFTYYFFLGFNLFMGMIGSFTLAVGGIGVANIMFVVVQERMREIGIRRSVGAKRLNIMIQFFAETFFVVGLGGALGYGIGWLVVQGMQFIPIKEYVGTPQFTPEVGIGAFLVLAIVGLAAGLMPARRASRLDVVECLRT
jgi:putative ABC transport system permease protein